MKSAHQCLAKGGRFLLLELRGLVEINAPTLFGPALVGSIGTLLGALGTRRKGVATPKPA